jgi:hypothetical protein
MLQQQFLAALFDLILNLKVLLQAILFLIIFTPVPTFAEIS